MMLQGHFIDTLLLNEYKDSSSLAFQIWSYFRGITAPTFFTISGLIFTYLLFKSKGKNDDHRRIKKGLVRGVMLIGLGYLLRIQIFEWLSGHFNTSIFKVDVLQIIGLSLIGLIILYLLCLKYIRVFSTLCLVLGTLIFVSEPLYRAIVLDKLPLFLSNYISKSNGSVFTFLPWFGYMCFGAHLATLFYRFLERSYFKPSILFYFLGIGFVLINWSSFLLMQMYQYTDIELFYDSANYNYLFTRLGNVFIYFAIFYGFENFIKTPLFLKIGQKTLSIYVIHFIIMYGSFTGYGLNTFIGKSLTPWEAVFGALVFLILVCCIAFNYAKTNAFLYKKSRKSYTCLKSFLSPRNIKN